MKCPNCGAENRFNAISCQSCGASLIDAPADEPIDLDRFAPTHSDPLAAPGTGAPEAQAPEIKDPNPPENIGDNSASQKLSGRELSEKAKAAGKKVYGAAASAAAGIGESSKKLAGAVGGKVDNASGWVAEKIRPIILKFDDGNGIVEDDERFRKIVLAVMLGVLAVILIILFSFCGACNSCSCDACTPDTLAGTWVEARSMADGYQPTDYIVELTGNGQLIGGGVPAGSYQYSEDYLTMTINGMEYSCVTAAGAEEMTLSLHGMDSVQLQLFKLSDETGLTGEEISQLYPDA